MEIAGSKEPSRTPETRRRALSPPPPFKFIQARPFAVSEETAWQRVEELRFNSNQSTFGVSPQATFGQLAGHYMQHELPENQDNATIENSWNVLTTSCL